MRPAARFSGAALRRAIRTPLRAQSPANCVIARASAASKPIASNVRSFSSSMRVKSIMPDAEDPKPREAEPHDEPGKVTELSTEEFHERADHYLNELVERLEEAQEKDPQIEVEYSVCTLI
jgi:frataxin